MNVKPYVAVVGCGYWGKNLVRNFNELGALRMVCDGAEGARQLAAEMAPHAEVVATVNAVWSAPVEGLVIATPAETHHALTRQALVAGKDVLVEKPLALTCEQGVELVRLAERQGRLTDGSPPHGAAVAGHAATAGRELRHRRRCGAGRGAVAHGGGEPGATGVAGLYAVYFIFEIYGSAVSLWQRERPGPTIKIYRIGD